ncbi:hypothetical protein Sjap_011094 [Stephania japonica]|uniref:Uncharacterized protein n=1 Tax=Stephania japonica TaxID=461633 RepID=A0AAP0JCV3_9MAGN
MEGSTSSLLDPDHHHPPSLSRDGEGISAAGRGGHRLSGRPPWRKKWERRGARSTPLLVLCSPPRLSPDSLQFGLWPSRLVPASLSALGRLSPLIHPRRASTLSAALPLSPELLVSSECTTVVRPDVALSKVGPVVESFGVRVCAPDEAVKGLEHFSPLNHSAGPNWSLVESRGQFGPWGKFIFPHRQSWRGAQAPLLDPDHHHPPSLSRDGGDLRRLARRSPPLWPAAVEEKVGTEGCEIYPSFGPMLTTAPLTGLPSVRPLAIAPRAGVVVRLGASLTPHPSETCLHAVRSSSSVTGAAGLVGVHHRRPSRPSPQNPQSERRTIEDIEKDMISDLLSPSTNDQEIEEEIKSILQKISSKTVSAIPLKSVEVNEITPVEDYWSETIEELEVSLSESEIIIAQNEEGETEKEIEVISKWPDEPHKESKEDQPLVLMKPPSLPCIFVEFYEEVKVKERSQIFYTADTFVLDDHAATESFVLEVPDELPNLKEGIHVSFPKVLDALFVVDILKGEGITRHGSCMSIGDTGAHQISSGDSIIASYHLYNYGSFEDSYYHGVNEIFYTADTFVSDDHDAIESYVLEIPDELLNLKKSMPAELPKAIDAPFIVDISKEEGIT